MQNEEDIDFMDITQVLRVLKDEGSFIQIERDGANWLVTPHVMLRLREKDAFKVQCRTETRRRGVWYSRAKSVWSEYDKKVETDAYLERYGAWTAEAADRGIDIIPTGLFLADSNGTKVDSSIYVGAGGYTLVRQDHLAMIAAGKYECRRIDNTIVVNGNQIIATVKDSIWQENPFLAREAKA